MDEGGGGGGGGAAPPSAQEGEAEDKEAAAKAEAAAGAAAASQALQRGEGEEPKDYAARVFDKVFGEDMDRLAAIEVSVEHTGRGGGEKEAPLSSFT